MKEKITDKVREIKQKYAFSHRQQVEINEIINGRAVSFDIHDRHLFLVEQLRKEIAVVKLEDFSLEGKISCKSLIGPLDISVMGEKTIVSDMEQMALMVFSTNNMETEQIVSFPDYAPAQIKKINDGVLYGIGWNMGQDGGTLWKWKPGDTSPEIVYKRDESFSPRSLEISETRFYIGNYRQNRMDIINKQGKLLESRMMIAGRKNVIFTETHDDELVGITGLNVLIKFSREGNEIYNKKLSTTSTVGLGGYGFIKMYLERLYALDAKNGTLDVFDL